MTRNRNTKLETRTRALHIEQLEDRQLLSASPWNLPVCEAEVAAALVAGDCDVNLFPVGENSISTDTQTISGARSEYAPVADTVEVQLKYECSSSEGSTGVSFKVNYGSNLTLTDASMENLNKLYESDDFLGYKSESESGILTLAWMNLDGKWTGDGLNNLTLEFSLSPGEWESTEIKFEKVSAAAGYDLEVASVKIYNHHYNSGECSALQEFLNTTDSEGKTNGSKINASYDVNDALTWTGVTWTGTHVQTIKWPSKDLKGSLNVSKFEELTTLDISGNTAINGLNISDCTSLETLNVSGCTSFGTLDVSTCIVLESLDVSNTSLTELDLAKNTKLNSLTIGNCAKLTTLNVSGCTSFGTLDVSTCTALESLDVSNTSLTSLDLAKNIRLNRLTVSGCTALKTVYTHQSQIRKMNVVYGENQNDLLDSLAWKLTNGEQNTVFLCTTRTGLKESLIAIPVYLTKNENNEPTTVEFDSSKLKFQRAVLQDTQSVELIDGGLSLTQDSTSEANPAWLLFNVISEGSISIIDGKHEFNPATVTVEATKTASVDGKKFVEYLSGTESLTIDDSLYDLDGDGQTLLLSDGLLYYRGKNDSLKSWSAGILTGTEALISVTLSGTAKVGETLTATVGLKGATCTYQWYRGDKEITDATDSTYELTESDRGQTIKCVATGAGDYSGTAEATTDKVTQDLTTVTLSGTAKVGETLTATVGPDGATCTYQWYRGDEKITDATDSTYELTESDRGQTIKCVATGAGDYSGTAEATTDKVTQDLTTVTLSGTAKVGETLTATVGPDGATCTYQWYRGDEKITDATDSTYELTESDRGQTIKCVATGKGDYSGTVEATTDKVTQDLTTVTLSGTAKVGETLTATVGPDGADCTYQWYRGKNTIEKATGSTYELTESDRGQVIKCVATGKGDYSGTAEATTDEVTQDLTTVTLSGTAKVGETLTATVGPDGADCTYQWYRGNEKITDATDSTYELTESDRGQTIKCVATGKGDYSGTAEATTDKVTQDLAVPSALQSTARTSSSITLEWTGVSNASGYTVTYSTSEDFTEAQTKTVDTGTSVTIEELTPNTMYYFKVKAVGAGYYNSSEDCEAISVTTLLSTPTLNTPTASGQTASVSWSAVTNATGYQLEYKLSTDTNWTTKSVTETSTTFTGTAGLTYNVRVKAIGDNTSYTDSDYSSTYTILLLAVPDGYNADDLLKLAAFLGQTDSDGQTNGSKISESYNVEDPTTWTGVTWSDAETGKQVTEIDWNGRGLVGSLDVSDCANLEELDCGMNQLTELKVSKCTALLNLDCDDCGLTELDVSKCTELLELSCCDNYFTTFDVSQCTKLTVLYCGYSELDRLDVSNNTQLETLSCEASEFDTLDVSANTNLKTLCCVSSALKSVQLLQSQINQLSIYMGGNEGTWTFKNASEEVLASGVTGSYLVTTVPFTAENQTTKQTISFYNKAENSLLENLPSVGNSFVALNTIALEEFLVEEDERDDWWKFLPIEG